MVVGIHEGELSEIVGIGMVITEPSSRRATEVIGVIHAGTEIVVCEGDILMIKAECVADFLARGVLPNKSVAWSKPIIIKHRSRHVDVTRARILPDLHESQPSGIPVVGTAHLDPAVHGTANQRISAARDDGEIEGGRSRPIRQGHGEHRIPCSIDIVSHLKRKGSAVREPVVAHPPVPRKRDLRRSNTERTHNEEEKEPVRA